MHPIRCFLICFSALTFCAVVRAGTVLSIPNPASPDWTQNVLRDGSLTTVAATTPGNALWQVDYTLSPGLAPGATNQDTIAFLYNGFTWSPAADGAVERIDVSMDGDAITSSFNSGVSGFLRPVLLQNGSIFGVSFTGRQIALSDAATLNSWSLLSTDNWVTIDGGTGLDLSASGAPIQFGFRWDLGVQAPSTNTGPTAAGSTARTTIDNLRFEIFSAAVGQPPTASVPDGASTLALAVIAALGLIVGRRWV